MTNLICGIAVFIFIIIYPIAYINSEKETIIDVTNKERIVQGNGKDMESFYLVYAEQGVYAVKDSLWYWEWDSSDRYNQLKPGHTYRVTVAGWRSGFLSMYPNIVHLVLVK